MGVEGEEQFCGISFPTRVILRFLNSSDIDCDLLQTVGEVADTNSFQPTCLVARLTSVSQSIVLKRQFDRLLFEIESANLRYLNRLLPLYVPKVLYEDHSNCVFLLEDVGDEFPLPSDNENDSDSVTSQWRRILISLADIHHFASVRELNPVSMIGDVAARKPFYTPAFLAAGLYAGCSSLSHGQLALSVEQDLVRGLIEVVEILEEYRAAWKPYVIGERSSRNIRILGQRIIHIDHSASPDFVPSGDLVSIWRSPRRQFLLENYLEHRLQLNPNFDADAFSRCDHAFTIYNCGLWCGLRMRTLRDPKARIPPPSQSPIAGVLENLSVAISCGQELNMVYLTGALLRLADSLRASPTFLEPN
jgi:hypothetical protein